MSNDPEPDDEEPIDDARIDAFLDRLEDAEPVEADPDAATGGSGTTDRPTGGTAADRSATASGDDDDRPAPEEAADPSDRLWDGFGSATDAEPDAEPTGTDAEPDVEPTGTDGTPRTADSGASAAADAGEPATTDADWSAPEESAGPASAGPSEPSPIGGDGTDATEQSTGFEFGAEPAAVDDASDTTDRDETAVADTSEADTADRADPDAAEAGGSSFSSVLDRISHRVTGGGADTDRDDTGADDGWGADGREASGSASRSSQADTIDRILNNIDAFGRATASSQVLLLSPTAHSITNEIYRRFLVPDDGTGQNILFVSATGTVDDQLATAEEIPAWAGGKTAVIEVGRSGLRPSEPGAGPDPTRRLDIYKNISNLKHLAKLGVNISHIVSQWDGERRPTVVGVHTLSAIQQYVGNETMFQFLFTLKGQLNSRGVMGFYHMHPGAHTDTELDTITSAFDIVIRISSDGSVDIE